MRTKSKSMKQNTIPASKPVPVTSSVSNYQSPSIIDNIKAGFGVGIGASISNRIADSILGNRTVDVVNKQETSNLQEKAISCSDIHALDTSTSKNDKCDYIINDIRFNRCDIDINNSKCNELFRSLYSCQKNI